MTPASNSNHSLTSILTKFFHEFHETHSSTPTTEATSPPQELTQEVSTTITKFDEQEHIRKFNAQVAERDRRVAVSIQGLEFPASFYSLKMKDAFIFRIVKFMLDLQPVGFKINGMFLSFIDEIGPKYFTISNLLIFKVFIRKLRENLENPAILDNASHKRTKTFLELLFQEEIDGERTVGSFLPKTSNEASSSQETFNLVFDFCQLLIKIIEDNLSCINEKGLNDHLKTQEALNRKMAPDKRVDLSDGRSLLSKVITLKSVFSTRKKIILDQLKLVQCQFSTLNSESAPSVQYALSQVMTSIKLLYSFNTKFSKECDGFRKDLELGITEEQEQITKKSFEIFHFSSSATKTEDEDFRKKSKVLAEKTYLINRKSEKKEKSKDLEKKDTTSEDVAQLTEDLDKSLREQFEGFRKLSEIMQQAQKSMEELAEAFNRSVQNKQKQREEVRKVRLDKAKKLGKSKELANEDQIIVAQYEIFTLFRTGSEFCGTGIKLAENLILSQMANWVPASLLTSVEPDIDKLWPIYHDSLARQSQAKPAHQRDDDKKEDEVEVSSPKSPVVKIESKPAIPTKQLSSRYKQTIQLVKACEGLSWNLDPSLSIEEGENRQYFAKLDLKDSAHHLKVLFGTIERLKKCLKKEKKESLNSLIFSIVRSVSIITEQNLTAEYTIRFGTKDINHSQIDLLSRLPSRRNKEEQAEMEGFLKKIDYMVFGHRCPHNLSKTNHYRGITDPQALKWMLDMEKVQPNEMMNLVVSTLRFMEMRTASHFGADHTLSNQIKEELLQALKSSTESSKEEHPMSKTLKKDLQPLFDSCGSLVAFIEKKIRSLGNQINSENIVAHYQDALLHAKLIKQDIKLWVDSPETEDLASLGDSMWTHLQILDEQLETAHNFKSNSCPQRMHSLVAYRELRGHIEKRYADVLDDLEQGIDSHYVHYGVATRKANHQPMPLGLTWRLESVEASLVGSSLDEQFSAIGTEGQELTPEVPVELRKQLMNAMQGELEMSLELVQLKE